ncbi:MAG TPA: HAMP domain-containing sensor histidine kinase [Chloroflexia bacterium]|nr:HAMP domain-containing sensor histidine kinase [Chloroflexia bacterium]
MIRRIFLSYLLLAAVTVTLLFALTARPADARSLDSSYQPGGRVSDTLPVVLSNYYVQHGNWQDVQAYLQEASALTGFSLTLTENQQVVASTNAAWLNQSVNGSFETTLGAPLAIPGSPATLYLSAPPLNASAGKSLSGQISSTDNNLPALLITGLVVLCASFGLSLLVVRSISRPLAEVRLAASRIAQGDYSVRVQLPARRKDELATFLQSFNTMADSVSRIEQRRRKQVAETAHDMRTPLSVVKGYLEGLLSNQIADRRTAERTFQSMHREVSRMLEVINHFGKTAASGLSDRVLNREQVTIQAVVNEALARVAPLAEAKNIELKSEVAVNLPAVMLDPVAFGQALYNLLDNAIRHSNPNGNVIVKAGQNTNQIWLKVIDSGEGISPEHLPHIFERYYQGNRNSGSAGLGLAIVKEIVAAHGGEVRSESSGLAGEGSIFTISLFL